MGMLKSRADELERRLNQTREVLKGSDRSLDSVASDVKALASDVEKIEGENEKLKKDLEDQKKGYERTIADLKK